MDKNNGGPAFPTTEESYASSDYCSEGMTLHDYFAAKAMQWILANPVYFAALQDQAVSLDSMGHDCDAFKLVSQLSQDMADAMLEARPK